MKAYAGESLVEGEQPCAAEAASLLAIACRLATPAAKNKKILMARESTACEEGQSC